MCNCFELSDCVDIMFSSVSGKLDLPKVDLTSFYASGAWPRRGRASD